ncbi:MAG: hypothetical protein RR931_01395 [Mucinivorans sp.]
MKKKLLKILSYALIALFLSYYAESTLFTHSHTFSWGTVTHSHPYLPNGGHSHTATECQTISLLNNILLTPFTTVTISVAVVVCFLLYNPQLLSIAKHIVENCSLRAPPSSTTFMSR